MKDHSIEGFIGGVILTLVVILPWASFEGIEHVNATIEDNGCASHQELSQTKSNADVYNYAALSTSY